MFPGRLAIVLGPRETKKGEKAKKGSQMGSTQRQRSEITRDARWWRFAMVPQRLSSLAFALAPLLAGCGSDHLILAQEREAGPLAVASAQETPPRARSQQAEPEPPQPPIQQTTFEADKLPEGLSDKPALVKIVARVNDKVILDEEVRDAALPQILQLPPEERSQHYHAIYNRELQKIIDRELILLDLDQHFGKTKPQYLSKLQEAAKRECDKHIRIIRENIEKKNGIKVGSDEELRKILRSQGVMLQGYRRQRERDFMAMEYMRAIIFPLVRDSVGRQEIVDYYEQHAPEFATIDRVNWQDIFIDTQKFRDRGEASTFASQVADRARKGENFTALVKQYDHGVSVYHGGDGVWSRRGEVQPPELEPVLFELHKGEVGPVLEVTNGFHIIRLVEREHAGKKPLDDKLQAEIRRKLQSEIADREMRRVTVDLRRKSAIEILDDERK